MESPPQPLLNGPKNKSPQEPSELTLRFEVRPRDPAKIRELVFATGFFNSLEIGIAVELVQEWLDKGPASGYDFVLAERDGALVGYTCYGLIPCTDFSYDMYWIAVHPDYQRHGLGRRLIAETESRVRKAGGHRVYVETSSRDQYASTRAFYERCGYRVEARMADYYRPGDGKVVYCKVLRQDAGP